MQTAEDVMRTTTADVKQMVGFYLGAHTLNWMGFAYLAFSAFSELLKRDHLNVIGFCITASVIAGVHFLGGIGLVARVTGDHTYTRMRGNGHVLMGHHHSPFFFHWGAGTVMKVMLMAFFWTFNAQHKTAKFNDHRWSQTIPAEDTLMYLQWTAGMVLTVVFFLIHTINLKAVYERVWDPKYGRIRGPESSRLVPY